MDPAHAEEFRRRYLADQIETASPVQRLLMLFNRFERDLDAAEEGFKGHDLKVVSDNLVHAQQILFALRDPLEQTSELGRSLRAIYTFCIERLITANLRKDRALVPAVRALVGQIAEANRTAAATFTHDALVVTVLGGS